MDVQVQTAEALAVLDRVLSEVRNGSSSSDGDDVTAALLRCSDARDVDDAAWQPPPCCSTTPCAPRTHSASVQTTARDVRAAAVQCSARDGSACASVQCVPRTSTHAVQTPRADIDDERSDGAVDAAASVAQLVVCCSSSIACACEAMARAAQHSVDAHSDALQRRLMRLHERLRRLDGATRRIHTLHRAVLQLCDDEHVARSAVCDAEADARLHCAQRHARAVAANTAAQGELLGLLDECWQVLRE